MKEAKPKVRRTGGTSTRRRCYRSTAVLDQPRHSNDFRQILDKVWRRAEGLQFKHQHHVAHRDLCSLNDIMDASKLCIDEYPPFYATRKLNMTSDAQHSTRTPTPVKYYIAEFGLSRKYDASDSYPLETPILGGDKTVPEFQKSLEPRDSLPTDVNYIGNLICHNFTEGHEFASRALILDFIKPLIVDMVQDDPSKRPTTLDESSSALNS
ncbi:hypothetical protein HGRIS_001339 [Hohenbuehelia grisea]|uniref:Protein kinase domain-containing protein n=1 Tax=Hohenbuehelia grisea TaxID=104357 RepID=A0ABR3JP85_9AGAR